MGSQKLRERSYKYVFKFRWFLVASSLKQSAYGINQQEDSRSTPQLKQCADITYFFHGPIWDSEWLNCCRAESGEFIRGHQSTHLLISINRRSAADFETVGDILTTDIESIREMLKPTVKFIDRGDSWSKPHTFVTLL